MLTSLISKIITNVKPIMLFDTSDFVTKITMYQHLEKTGLLNNDVLCQIKALKNYLYQQIPNRRDETSATLNLISETCYKIDGSSFDDFKEKHGFDIFRNELTISTRSFNWLLSHNLKTKDFSITIITRHDPKEKTKLQIANSPCHKDSLLVYQTQKNAIEIHSLLLYIKLINELNEPCAGRNTIIQAMATLFYIQQSKLNIKVDNKNEAKNLTAITQLNKTMQHFLKTFKPIYNEKEQREQTPTYLDLINYFNDVKKQKSIQPIVFNWIYQNMLHNTTDKNTNDEQTDDVSSSFVAQQISHMKIDNSLKLVTTDQEKKEFEPYLEKLQSDTYFKENHKIIDIYKLPLLKDHHYHDGDAKHLTLIHGTGNISILSILKYGLLDNDSLDAIMQKDDHIHMNYTGSGLGRGIYFARLDQVSKSVNYTDGKNISYLFIADVAYTSCETRNSYDSKTLAPKYDLRHAEKVGSYDRDEYVAKSFAQVHPLYMIAIK